MVVRASIPNLLCRFPIVAIERKLEPFHLKIQILGLGFRGSLPYASHGICLTPNLLQGLVKYVQRIEIGRRGVHFAQVESLSDTALTVCVVGMPKKNVRLPYLVFDRMHTMHWSASG